MSFGRWTNGQLFRERERYNLKWSALQLSHIKIIKDYPDPMIRIKVPQIASEVFQKECLQIESYRNRVFEIETELKKRGVHIA